MIILAYLALGIPAIITLLKNKPRSSEKVWSLALLSFFIHATYMGYGVFSAETLTVSFILEIFALSLALILLINGRSESLKLSLTLWPLAVFFLALSLFIGSHPILVEEDLSHAKFLLMHIGLGIIGLSCFFTTSHASAIYLWQNRKLKERHTFSRSSFLPNLHEVNRIQKRTLVFGLTSLSLSIILGRLSPLLSGQTQQVGLHEVLSIMIWVFYLTLAILHFGLQIKKYTFAYCSLIGSALVILFFAMIKISNILAS